jgi:acyl-CoA thioester hydrolase
MANAPRDPPPRRAEYPREDEVTTRWMDNDVYGHVNNAHYFAYFDSAINRHLIREGGLDIHGGAIVGFVVASRCDYFRPVRYPDPLAVGLCTDRVGTSSVTYGLALFLGDEEEARAAGAMTHVFVDRASGKPVPIPPRLRAALEAIARRPRAP